MQFIITAYDYKDGLEKRLKAREAHIKLGNELKEQGHYLMGVALLDDNQKMVGSVMIMEYPSKKELDEWLKEEPYMINKVWEKVEIKQCKVGPTFSE